MRRTLDIMDESEGNVIGLKATGKLIVDDYDDMLTPKLDALVGRYGAARALIYMEADFKVWVLSAAWANMKPDVRRRGDLEKVAIVGAPAWEEWCVRLAGLLMKGELRTFRADQLQDAWDWIRR